MTTAHLSNEISAIENILPALSGSNVTYNKNNNIFLSEGYTSAAGNTYYQGMRLSERILIKYDFGEGYLYTFLNGINIYGFDGRNTRLIATRSYYSRIFSEYYAKNECIEMLKEYLTGQMKIGQAKASDSQLETFAQQIVTNTLKNKINNLID